MKVSKWFWQRLRMEFIFLCFKWLPVIFMKQLNDTFKLENIFIYEPILCNVCCISNENEIIGLFRTAFSRCIQFVARILLQKMSLMNINEEKSAKSINESNEYCSRKTTSLGCSTRCWAIAGYSKKDWARATSLGEGSKGDTVASRYKRVSVPDTWRTPGCSSFCKNAKSNALKKIFCEFEMMMIFHLKYDDVVFHK